MARSWFRFSSQEDEMTQNSVPRAPASDAAAPTGSDGVDQTRQSLRSFPAAAERGSYLTFDQIYQGSSVNPPKIAYGILKWRQWSTAPIWRGCRPKESATPC